MTAGQHTGFEQGETGRPGAASPRKALVWDAPVRIFHWLMVLAFAGAWLTGEQDDWRLVHVTLGYTMAGLVAFRAPRKTCCALHWRSAMLAVRPVQLCFSTTIAAARDGFSRCPSVSPGA